MIRNWNEAARVLNDSTIPEFEKYKALARFRIRVGEYDGSNMPPWLLFRRGFWWTPLKWGVAWFNYFYDYILEPWKKLGQK